MVEGNKWRLVWYYPRGCFLFSKPAEKDIFKSKRCQPVASVEVIIVLEIIDDADSISYSLDEALKKARKNSKKKAGFSCKPIKNRLKKENCKSCGKETRSDNLKRHMETCGKKKSPKKIAKCKWCSYSDKDGNLRRHSKKTCKRLALPAHQQKLDEQNNPSEYLMIDQSEAETSTNSLIITT
jgi:hypothetical protein